MSLRRTARNSLIAISLSLVAIAAGGLPVSASTPSAISQRYSSDSALRALLGSPRDNEYAVSAGREQDFKNGSLYSSSNTGVHEVHGAILGRYNALGGPKGKLGFPTTDEGHTYIKYDYPEQRIGSRNDFANGAIEWVRSTNQTIWIGKAIAAVFPYQTYPYWGTPSQDQHAASHGAQVLTFNDGRIYLLPNGTTHFMNGGYPDGSDGILPAYALTGYDTGPLGLPASDEIGIDANAVHEYGKMQKFDGGAIYQRGYLLGVDFPDAQAHTVRGAIYYNYSHNNGLETLGFPTSNEQDAPGGRVSYFEHGSMFWNSSTNKVTTTVTP